MGIPTSEAGYTAAMSRREDHEVHKDMWWQWTKKKSTIMEEVSVRGDEFYIFNSFFIYFRDE